jgi:Holliday junction resolvasome RuvABC endonuclease subunit
MIVWGIDPSFSHTALVSCDYNKNTDTYSNWNYCQIDSSPRKQKLGEYKFVVDFERCYGIITEWGVFISQVKNLPEYIFIEAPVGSQSSRAAIGYGVSWTVVSYITSKFPESKIVLYSPKKIKEGITGNQNASKIEMINAANDYFPDFPWKKNKKGKILSKEEHKADALCTLRWGVENEIQSV